MSDTIESTITIQAMRRHNNTAKAEEEVNLTITKAPNFKSDYTVEVTDPEFYPFFNTIVDGSHDYFLYNNEYRYRIDKEDKLASELKDFLPQPDGKKQKQLKQFTKMTCPHTQKKINCDFYDTNGKKPQNIAVQLTRCVDNSKRKKNDIDQLSYKITSQNGEENVSFDLLDVMIDKQNKSNTNLMVDGNTYVFKNINRESLNNFLEERNRMLHTPKVSGDASQSKPAYVALNRIRCILNANTEPLKLQCSNTNPDSQSEGMNTGASREEALLREIAELKRENKIMAQKLEDIGAELQCHMCMDVSEKDALLKCGHNFCTPCLENWKGTGRTNGKKCPVCKTTSFVKQNGELDVLEHRAFRNIAQVIKYTKIFPGDEKYIGDLSDSGLRHGHGKCFYPNGDFYDGEWVNDKREGRGVMTFAFEHVWSGVWQRNKKHGPGLHVFPDGSSMQEFWLNDYQITSLDALHDAQIMTMAMSYASGGNVSEDVAKMALSYGFYKMIREENDRAWDIMSLFFNRMTFGELLQLNTRPDFRLAKIQEAMLELAARDAMHASTATVFVSAVF